MFKCVYVHAYVYTYNSHTYIYIYIIFIYTYKGPAAGALGVEVVQDLLPGSAREASGSVHFGQGRAVDQRREDEGDLAKDPRTPKLLGCF